MKNRTAKLLFSVIVLTAYIGVTAFGLSQTRHNEDMSMNKCPYTLNSTAVCSSNLDHLSNWQKFSNLIVASPFVLPLIIFIVLFFLWNPIQLLLSRWRMYLSNKKPYPFFYKIIRWLSLFENSPPVGALQSI